jgi:hypothetical protein
MGRAAEHHRVHHRGRLDGLVVNMRCRRGSGCPSKTYRCTDTPHNLACITVMGAQIHPMHRCTDVPPHLGVRAAGDGGKGGGRAGEGACAAGCRPRARPSSRRGAGRWRLWWWWTRDTNRAGGGENGVQTLGVQTLAYGPVPALVSSGAEACLWPLTFTSAIHHRPD